jgi:hypothetical protein
VGRHQTSVGGVGVPTLADLLRLADEGGIERKTALDLIDRTRGQAATLGRALRNAPVRAATVREIVRKVAENDRRLQLRASVPSPRR